MTYEEVIKRLRYKAENIKAKLEPSYFSDCADYLKKYRWHELRKNPDDLPPKETEVLTYDGGLYFLATYDHELKHWRDSCDGTKLWFVKAWREIEPFEDF